jgi:hypothetical protein
LNDKLDWTQKLGDAFLGQQKAVMDAVQRLRARAQAEGNLKSTKEQEVKAEQIPVEATPPPAVTAPTSPAAPAAPAVSTQSTTVITIQPTNKLAADIEHARAQAQEVLADGLHHAIDRR